MSDPFSSPSIPEPIEELMAGYVLEILSPEEREAFEYYLQAHPELPDELQQLYAIVGLVAQTAASVALSSPPSQAGVS